MVSVANVASLRGRGRVRVSPQDGVGKLALSFEKSQTREREDGETSRNGWYDIPLRAARQIQSDP